MKKMKKTIILLATFLTSTSLIAQEGKPSVKVFSNFNYDISAEEGEQAFKEFEIKRAYLGYSHNLNDKFSTKITFDVGSNSGGSSYTAFLKVAALKWKYNEKMTFNIGMIGTKNFKFQEKVWGKRYIEKSAQDKYKWASSADAGISLDYKIGKLLLDAQILNGEGYKKLQSDNGLFKGGLGMTYAIMDNITIRVHQDFSPRTEYGENDDIQTITTASIKYSSGDLIFGAEQGIMQNAANVSEKEKDIVSIYASYALSGFTMFARYDDLSSDGDWNIDNEGTFTIVGVEKQMTKGVTLSLNMQTWEGAAEESEKEETLFLNLEYKF